MNVDTQLLALISGSLIPLLTAILTRLEASRGVKALCSAVLAGATALVAYLTDFASVGTWKEAVYVGVAALIANGATYYGFWQPSGVAPGLARSTDGFGIG